MYLNYSITVDNRQFMNKYPVYKKYKWTNNAKMTFYNLFMQITQSIALASLGFSQELIKTFVFLAYFERNTLRD